MRVRLEQQLRDAGLRVTNGRVAMLETLDQRPHSDAETLYELLREQAHETSIQSVHNVLSDLTRVGLIRRIEPAGSPARYERRVKDNHHHAVCTGCGSIADIDCVIGHAPCLTPSGNTGFMLSTAEVTFWGLCETCQSSDAVAATKSTVESPTVPIAHSRNTSK